MLLWLLLRWQTASVAGGWWRQRSVQSGTNVLLTTIAMLVILGGINFLAVRTSAQIDLTESQQFSLAPQTKEILRDLKAPVNVLVFTNQQGGPQQALLEQYQRQNPDRFSFEFVDPQAKPGLAEKYNVRTLGEVVVETEGRTRTVEGVTDGGLTETQLTPALLNALNNRQVNLYVIQGHGEAPINGGQGNLDEAVAELKKRDVTVSVLNLIEQKAIPEDAAVLVIAGPKRPFLEPEVKLLKDYLAQGKSLMMLLDPGVNTGLEPLLKDWGVELDNRIVVDASGSGQFIGLGPAVPLVLEYGAHPITQDFNQSPSFFPLAQAVTVNPPGNEQAVDLLRTNAQSWAEADPDQEELAFDAARDRQGPLTLGVAITRDLNQSEAQPGPEAQDSPENAPENAPETPPETPDAEVDKPDAAQTNPETEPRQAKLVVIGDSDFATAGAFSKAINGDIFLNAVSWLGSGQDDASLSIRPKEPTDRRLELTPMKWRAIIVGGLGFLPLAAFGSAGYLWWRRR